MPQVIEATATTHEPSIILASTSLIETHPYITTNGFLDHLMLTEQEVEAYEFLDGGIWSADTLTIISGTYPPTREYKRPDGTIRRGYIHFSSPRNKYWRHIDNLYGTKLYIPSNIAKLEEPRIKNALAKIAFLKKKKIGFIDIFSKVKREVANSSKDIHLIPVETIFDNGIFENTLENKVKQFGFVYSLARDIFLQKLLTNYDVNPRLIRRYNADGIPLEVKRVTVKRKDLYITYAPIHGKIKDDKKRTALKMIMELGHE